VIWAVIYFGPVLLLFGGAAFVVWRIARRRKLLGA